MSIPVIFRFNLMIEIIFVNLNLLKIFYLSIIFNSDVNFLRFSKISLISSADHDARGLDRRNFRY